MKNLIYLFTFLLVMSACEKSKDNDQNENQQNPENPENPLAENVLADYLPDEIAGSPDKTEIYTNTVEAYGSITNAYRLYRQIDNTSKVISINIKDYNDDPTTFQGEKMTIENWEFVPGNVANEITVSGFPGYELNATNDHVVIKLILKNRFVITAEYTVTNSVEPGSDILKGVLTGMNLAELAEYED